MKTLLTTLIVLTSMTLTVNALQWADMRSYQVLDVTSEGARITGTLEGLNDDEDCFINGLTGVYSGRSYTGQEVISDGDYTYTTVLGNIRTISAYRIPTANELGNHHYYRLHGHKKPKLQPIIVKTPEQLTTMTNHLFLFRKEQADKNNSARCQYQVGLMYINGEGTVTNKVLGIQYIRRAATNDFSDAVLYLKKNL